MPQLFTRLLQQSQAEHRLFSLSVDLTQRCNLRCVHCYQLPGESQVESGRLVQSIQEAAQAGALFLLCTGGELFLRRDWHEIIAAARTAGLFVRLFTHAGLISEPIAAQLMELGVYDVGVSYYAQDAALHERITQVRGSHQRTRRGIERLLAAGLHVTLKLSLFKGINDDQHRAVAAWARELGAPSRVRLEVNTLLFPRLDGDATPSNYMLSVDDQARVMREVQAQLPGAVTDEQACGPLDLQRDLPCNAGVTTLHIDFRGDVHPCEYLAETYGNIVVQPLTAIWEGVRARHRAHPTPRLDDFHTCRGCAYLPQCTPCQGVAEKLTGRATDAPEPCCARTLAAALARDDPKASAGVQPAGLRGQSNG